MSSTLLPGSRSELIPDLASACVGTLHKGGQKMVQAGDEIMNPRTGQRMTFLKTRQDTHGEVLQIDCFSPPNGVKELEHIHPFQENRFEVLSGSMMFSVSGTKRQVNARETIAIPPKAPHFFWNESDQEVHYIQEFRPALRSEDFFETLFSLARKGKLNEQGTANPFLMAVVIPAFWNEIRVTNPPEFFQRVFFGALNPVGKLLGYRAV
jgi:quercetin dioxygenase-like cupin family protein